MSASALLALIALVASIDGDRATVEGDLLHYLRPGDVGQVRYELTVGSEERTIEVGTAEVLSVGSDAAEVQLTSDREVRPGFAVRFEVPFERLRGELESAAEREAALLTTQADLAATIVDKEILAARVADLERALAVEGADKAEAVETAPAAPLPTPEQLEARVTAWAAAWSKQDVETYLSFYLAAYQPPGMSRQQWEAQRTARLRAPEFIEIGIDAFEMTWATPDRAEVRFEQSYRSDTFQDRVTKALMLVLDDDTWRIAQEESQ